MNGVLGHLCAHTGLTGPGETPEDGETDEMTLPSRHRIQNSNPCGLRPRSLPLDHRGSPQYLFFTSERGKNILFFKTYMPERCRTPRYPTFQADSFNHCTRAPDLVCRQSGEFCVCRRVCGRVCRRVCRRVNTRSRVRVGVFCSSPVFHFKIEHGFHYVMDK